MPLNVSVATQTEASLPAGQAGNRDAAHQSGNGDQPMTCQRNKVLPLWFSVPSVAKKQNEPNFPRFSSKNQVLSISQFYILHSQFHRFAAAILTLPTGSLTLRRPDLDRKGKD